MPNERYCVTFYKTVTTDDGHDREISQQAIEVLARDEQAAADCAKSEFCRLRGLRNWSWHSDRFEIEKIVRPS